MNTSEKTYIFKSSHLYFCRNSQYTRKFTLTKGEYEYLTLDDLILILSNLLLIIMYAD